MLPLYLSLLMASVTPTDGQINFTDVTPLFSAAIKPLAVQYSTVQYSTDVTPLFSAAIKRSADQTFDAVVMGTGT